MFSKIYWTNLQQDPWKNTNFAHEVTDKGGAQYCKATRSVAKTERSKGLGARDEVPENFEFFSILDPWKLYSWLSKALSAKVFFHSKFNLSDLYGGTNLKPNLEIGSETLEPRY